MKTNTYLNQTNNFAYALKEHNYVVATGYKWKHIKLPSYIFYKIPATSQYGGWILARNETIRLEIFLKSIFQANFEEITEIIAGVCSVTEL